MSQLPLSELDDLMMPLRADSYPPSKPRIRPRLDTVPSRVPTMDDMDGLMPSFGTYIRTPEAEREALCENWCKPREPPAEPIPTVSAEEIRHAIREAIRNERLKPAPAKIKYCDELACSVPNCCLFEHKGSVPRTKCGCGCPE
jgi:hypothetical protein